jgi:hypothetical protein
MARVRVQLPDEAPWILRSKLVSWLIWLVVVVVLGYVGGATLVWWFQQ